MSDEATIAIEETSVATPRRRLTVDLFTSYALAAARVASWAAVSMFVVRRCGVDALAIVALIRGTLNLLSYVPSAVTPTLVRGYVESYAPPIASATPDSFDDGRTLAYRATPRTAARVGDSATAIIVVMAAVVVLLGTAYAQNVGEVHADLGTRSDINAAGSLALSIVAAIVVRLLGEPAAARLHAAGLLWIDNVALIGAEVAWACIASSTRGGTGLPDVLSNVGLGLVLGQFATLAVRRACDPARRRPLLCATPFRTLVAAVTLLYVGSLADYLYGSSNQILIDRHLGRDALAAYVPCLQIDGALLLIVSGIGVALFPRIARDARANAFGAIRRDYLVGTLVSLAMLAVAALAATLLAPWAIARWLGQVPPGTLAILPLVLIHTVVGGTAGIGRAVLLGMGRFKAYTISALVGGVANVLLALLFVLGFGWGLRGVVVATIVAVVGRCAIWMPWYVLRALRVPPIAPQSGALAH